MRPWPDRAARPADRPRPRYLRRSSGFADEPRRQCPPEGAPGPIRQPLEVAVRTVGRPPSLSVRSRWYWHPNDESEELKREQRAGDSVVVESDAHRERGARGARQQRARRSTAGSSPSQLALSRAKLGSAYRSTGRSATSRPDLVAALLAKEALQPHPLDPELGTDVWDLRSGRAVLLG